jgi:hypothetical protein
MGLVVLLMCSYVIEFHCDAVAEFNKWIEVLGALVRTGGSRGALSPNFAPVASDHMGASAAGGSSSAVNNKEGLGPRYSPSIVMPTAPTPSITTGEIVVDRHVVLTGWLRQSRERAIGSGKPSDTSVLRRFFVIYSDGWMVGFENDKNYRDIKEPQLRLRLLDYVPGSPSKALVGLFMVGL